MTNNSLSNNLRFYREKAGLRQSDAAARLGLVGNDRISHWEKGRMYPHLTNLFKLCVINNVTPQDLYGDLFERIKASI